MAHARSIEILLNLYEIRRLFNQRIEPRNRMHQPMPKRDHQYGRELCVYTNNEIEG